MVALDRIAHEQTVRSSVPEMATHLQSLFGRRLTAAILGIADPKAIRRYADGEQVPQPDVEQCIRSTYQVAVLIGQVESGQAIRGWFLGMNPALDDRAPAMVIRIQPDRVLQAARQFIANG